MSDINFVTIKANQLNALDFALSGIFPLSPPPTAVGRYALSRAAKVVGPAAQAFRAEHQTLLLNHAVKGEDGKPVTRDAGNGMTQYDLGAGFGKTTPAFDAEFKAIGDEGIVLTGCRMITHKELGDCPITLAQETALLGVLLVDEAPE